MEGIVSHHKFKVGQSVNYASGPFGAGGANNVYKVTQLLPPKATTSNIGLKVWPSPMSGWPRKASSVAIHNRGGLARRVGLIMKFDYGAAAELFVPKRKGGPRQSIGYRRFATAAEALRFAVEDFPAPRTFGVWMQVGDDRFDSDDIYRLYESREYPLRRRHRSAFKLKHQPVSRAKG